MATGNQTQITPPRVPIIDERTGAISRQWYRWFYSLYTFTGEGTGILPVTSGGTGLGTIPTNGQLLIGNGTGYTLNTLGAGAGISVTNGLGTIAVANTGVLSVSGGTTGLTPAAATIGAVTLAGTLIAVNGGTGFSSYAVGDLLYAATTTTLAKLPDVATGNALISGGVSTAPAWGKIGLTTHVSGVLPIANGGTNATATPTAGGIAYGTSTAYAFSLAGTSGQVLTSAGAGTPTWATPTTGTVTSVSVVSANGFAGTVATSTTTPEITLTTSITGLLKGNGTAISAAVSGTDYAPATSGTAILYGNGAGGFSNVTIGTGVSFVAGTLSATGTGGTVTSVSFTGGIVSVATATTTPALTVAGTSGGIPYFSSATTWATSAALAAGGLVVGGGAGATPATTATGTGVVTALGVNVGSAGAIVVNGGALGTPSSGTVTNLTGTASININGTVGATTANTGAFSTVSATSTITSQSSVRVVPGTGTNSALFYSSNTGATSFFGMDNSAGGGWGAGAYALGVWQSGPYSIAFGTNGTLRMILDSSGNLLITGTGSLGYGTGSGGAVTQGTSRTTGVTLSKSNGAITMFSAAGSVVAATFTVTNTKVAATDTIILNQQSGTNLYVLLVTAVAAGSFNITFYTTGGVATDSPVINFAVIKAVTA